MLKYITTDGLTWFVYKTVLLCKV